MVLLQGSTLENFLPNTQKSVDSIKIQPKAGRVVVELVVFANKA